MKTRKDHEQKTNSQKNWMLWNDWITLMPVSMIHWIVDVSVSMVIGAVVVSSDDDDFRRLWYVAVDNKFHLHSFVGEVLLVFLKSSRHCRMIIDDDHPHLYNVVFVAFVAIHLSILLEVVVAVVISFEDYYYHDGYHQQSHYLSASRTDADHSSLYYCL